MNQQKEYPKLTCPHCQNEDESLMCWLYQQGKTVRYVCNVCSKSFLVTDGESNDTIREGQESRRDTKGEIPKSHRN